MGVLPMDLELSAALEPFLRSNGILVFVFLFGAIWGSFFNVCIARIPLGKSVVSPGSHCFTCKTPVRALDNVPLLSYFILRGKCRACGAKFSPRYVFVELLMALLSVAVFAVFVLNQPNEALGVRAASYFTYFAFCGVLLVLSFIDFDTKRLPDVLTLPSIPVFFLAGFGTHVVTWQERAIGAAAGYVAVRLISDGYYYLRGREGLGLGDGKLLAVIGATLGYKALPPIVFFASLFGILVSVPLLLWMRKKRPAVVAPVVVQEATPVVAVALAEGATPPEAASDEVRFTQVPFGPFLALGALFFLLMGDVLWGWIYGFLTPG